MIPMTILYGWVLSILWRWFFVPAFNLSPITLVQAIGIALVIRFLLYTTQYHREEDREAAMIEHTINGFIMPFIFLGFGWVVRSFM